MSSDLGGAAVLAVGFAAILAAAELWRRLGSPSAESTRKLAHVGSGVAALALPFLIRSPWIVLALAVGMSALFALSQRIGVLPSLHAVDRRSRGSEYYPFAIFLVYVMAYDRPALYVSSVLVLAVADAFAALIGVRYGSLRYEVEDSQKSVEGSLIFLGIAFLAIHLPLLLMTDLSREGAVLAALLVAQLVTMFEAVSLGGSDNLFIPIGVVACLDRITGVPVGDAVYQNLSLLALAIAVLVITARFRWFNAGARIIVILFAYGAWAIGTWLWALPVLVALAASVLVGLRAGARRQGTVKVRYAAGVALPPFLVLLVGDVWPAMEDLWFGPYLACLGAVIVFWVRGHSVLFRDGTRWRLLAAVIAFAWACVVAVPLALDPGHPALAALAVLGAMAIAAAAEDAWTRAFRLEPQPQRWTARRFTCSLAAGLIVFAAQHAGAPGWSISHAPDPQRWFWERPLPGETP